MINRLPTSVLYFKSSHELHFHKPPDYSLLRVFGCLVYASVHSADKYAPRAVEGVFLGYPTGKKGYKILNLLTKQIFFSRHVIFHETSFPFLTQSSVNSFFDPHNAISWIDTLDDNSVPDFSDTLIFSSDTSPTDSPLFLNFVIPTDFAPNTTPKTTVPHTMKLDPSSILQSHNTPSHVLHFFDSQSDSLPLNLSPHVVPRLSTRIKTRPVWWQDYVNGKSTSLVSSVGDSQVSNHVSSPTKYSLHHYLSYDSLDPALQNFIANLSSIKEPSFFFRL